MTTQFQSMMLTIATMLSAWLMMQAGVAKKALEFKRTRRPCASCGRQAHACRCTRDAAGE